MHMHNINIFNLAYHPSISSPKADPLKKKERRRFHISNMHRDIPFFFNLNHSFFYPFLRNYMNNTHLMLSTHSFRMSLNKISIRWENLRRIPTTKKQYVQINFQNIILKTNITTSIRKKQSPQFWGKSIGIFVRA